MGVTKQTATYKNKDNGPGQPPATDVQNPPPGVAGKYAETYLPIPDQKSYKKK